MPHRAASLAACPLLIGAVIAWSAAPARALVATSCQSFASYDPDGAPEAVTDNELTTGSCTSSISQGTAFLNGDGEAGLGSFIARAEATILEGPIDGAYVYTRTTFSDTITVSSPGHSGAANLHATAFVQGVVDVTGTGEAVVRLDVFTNPGATSQLIFETCRNPIFPACFGSFDPYPRILAEFVDVDAIVFLDSQVIFGLQLTAQAGRGSSLTIDPGTALTDFSGGGALSWGGFDELSQNGVPLPSFSVTSESGTDWTQPVPEPGGASAMLASLAALASLLRRRSYAGTPSITQTRAGVGTIRVSAKPVAA